MKERAKELEMLRMVQEGRSISPYWIEQLLMCGLITKDKFLLRLTDSGLTVLSSEQTPNDFRPSR